MPGGLPRYIVSVLYPLFCSSKMEEISRIGPAAGEQAVSDVVQSINNMQSSLLSTGHTNPEPSNAFSRLGDPVTSSNSRLRSESSYGRGLSSNRGMGSSGMGSSDLMSGGMGSSSMRSGGLASSEMGNQFRGSSGSGGYGSSSSQRMYSKFSDGGSGGGNSVGGGMGRSSQVLDYAHQSRKGLMDPPNY